MTHHTVRLMGGLGNQMFQYAFARRIAHASGEPVHLDTHHGFNRDDRGRRLALDAFNTTMIPASLDDVPAGMGWGSPWHRVARAAWSALPAAAQRVRYERQQFQYDAAAIAPARPSYYFGYWQHPAYFDVIADSLRRDFQLRSPLSGGARDLAQEMAGTPSISVHVRSYLDVGVDGRVISQAQAHHGTCSPDFYRQAIERLANGKDSVCYVFADNVEWAKTRLQLQVPCRYVADLVRCSDAEELTLMAACRHHVISNSTFSWWGAWLGSDADKVVIAPKTWIRSLAPDAVDICPKDWVRV